MATESRAATQIPTAVPMIPAVNEVEVEIIRNSKLLQCTESVQVSAFRIFEEAKSKIAHLNKHGITYISAACLWIAIQNQGEPFTDRTIVCKLGLDGKQFANCLKSMRRKMGQHFTRYRSVDPLSYLNRWRREMEMSKEEFGCAESLIPKIKSMWKFASRQSNTIAATAAFLAFEQTGFPRSYDRVAKIACIDSSTLRATVKIYQKRLAVLAIVALRVHNATCAGTTVDVNQTAGIIINHNVCQGVAIAQ